MNRLDHGARRARILVRSTVAVSIVVGGALAGIAGSSSTALAAPPGPPPTSSGFAPPSPPTNVTATGDQVTVSWSPPISPGTAPVTSYEVFRSTLSTAATQIATVTAPTTTYNDDDVAGGVTYSYYVEATNLYGTSAPSNVASVVPSSGALTCSGYNGNAAFVCALYVDILGRAPDSGGLNSWLTALGSGVSRTQVAFGIIDSFESGTDYLDSIYEGCLGRPVDPSGVTTWISAFEHGATVEQVDAGILGSPEFYADSGSTNSGFVNGVYECILGRPADPTGLASWTAALSNGESRSQVVYAIDTSTEAYTDDVEEDYGFLLDRVPDPAGLTAWVGALESGVTDLQVIADIAGSQEFYDDATGT